MLVMQAFEQRNSVRVYGRQGKLAKCTKNTSVDVWFWQTKGSFDVR
jgi:hypothetical protein